jgi:hypothetical protein
MSVRCTYILIDGEAVNTYYKFRTLGKIYLIRCFYTNSIITIRNNNVNSVNNILVHGALLGRCWGVVVALLGRSRSELGCRTEGKKIKFLKLFLISKEGEFFNFVWRQGMSTALFDFLTVEPRSTSVRYCQNSCSQSIQRQRSISSTVAASSSIGWQYL